MAQAKFTLKRGQTRLQDVVLAAGAAEAQSDTISVNIDYTNIRKREVIQQLDAIKAKILQGNWPPL